MLHRYASLSSGRAHSRRASLRVGRVATISLSSTNRRNKAHINNVQGRSIDAIDADACGGVGLPYVQQARERSVASHLWRLRAGLLLLA